MATRKLLALEPTYFHVEEIAATDDISVGKVTVVGVGGIGFDGGGQRFVNLGTPTAASDATNKAYVDGIASGLDVKPSARLATTTALPTVTASGAGIGKTLTATANGALTVDGVAANTNDRVLVKNQATQADNGIYVVTQAGSGATPFILTRATDFDSNAGVRDGSFVFIGEGATNASTGWVQTTNAPITVDTTSLVFQIFTASVSYTFDQGLALSAGSVTVELDTAAGATTAGAGGGSSGLEFDVNSAAGKLRAAVDTAGGLQRNASGLGIKAAASGGLSVGASGASIALDNTPTTLQLTATGLKVVGVPLQFQVNGVATSTNVTAANLNALTAGGNADAVHDHGRIVFELTAIGAVAKGDGVYYSGNSSVSTGDCTNAIKSQIIGVANAAIATTTVGKIVRDGVITGTLTGATAGTPYFMGSTGQPVLGTSLPAGCRIIRLGWAHNATDLNVCLQDFGKKIS